MEKCLHRASRKRPVWNRFICRKCGQTIYMDRDISAIILRVCFVIVVAFLLLLPDGFYKGFGRIPAFAACLVLQICLQEILTRIAISKQRYSEDAPEGATKVTSRENTPKDS